MIPNGGNATGLNHDRPGILVRIWTAVKIPVSVRAPLSPIGLVNALGTNLDICARHVAAFLNTAVLELSGIPYGDEVILPTTTPTAIATSRYPRRARPRERLRDRGRRTGGGSTRVCTRQHGRYDRRRRYSSCRNNHCSLTFTGPLFAVHETPVGASETVLRWAV